MNDRELLELAAKAAGYWIRSEREPDFDDGKVWISDQDIDGVKYYPNWSVFDPLIDDGDALRLEVDVNMTTKHRFLEILAEENTSCSGDYIKARRRAITRYAAEIGKAMQ